MTDISSMYKTRFHDTGLKKRARVWQVLCTAFFQHRIDPASAVLDLACGYGDFINNIQAARKYAVDLNPDAEAYLTPDIGFFNAAANKLDYIEDETLDVVFTSNFLEHMPDKMALDTVFAELLRKLKPGGKFIILGPNIKYAYREYWDYYDHYIPLSHLSLAEGLDMSGFCVKEIIPRFLPFTMKNAMPTHPALIWTYLHLPLAWRIFGKQFLIVAEKDPIG